MKDTSISLIHTNRSRQRLAQRWGWVVLIVGAAMLLALFVWREPAIEELVEPLRVVAFESMDQVDGLYYEKGATNAFTGIIVERYRDDARKSRTEIKQGKLNGLSEGWFPSGQLQIREHFVGNVAEGTRTKWWENGKVQTEGKLVAGQWEGIYRKWHENGTLAQEIPMTKGQPNGMARAWFKSGALKSRVVMSHGQQGKSEYFEDGEVFEPGEEQGPIALVRSDEGG